MAGELSGDAGGAIPVLVEVVNGANVVQTTARNVVTAGGICTSHDPRRPQGNSVDLVGGVCIPDNQFAILRGRNEMSPISRPVHGVDLGQMSLECPLCLHQLVLGYRLV